jgi:hypothetical protein
VLAKGIKNKINLRKRILRRFRLTRDVQTKQRLDGLNYEIKQYCNMQRTKNVRKVIQPGYTKSLWKAVILQRTLPPIHFPKLNMMKGEWSIMKKLPTSFPAILTGKSGKSLAGWSLRKMCTMTKDTQFKEKHVHEGI